MIAPATNPSSARSRKSVTLSLMIGAVAFWSVVMAVAGGPKSAAPSRVAAFASLPLSFEVNSGQVDGPIQFLARGRGHSFLLAPTEAVVMFGQEPGMTTDALRRHTRQMGAASLEAKCVRFQFMGANPQARMSGLDLLPGKVNYFLGHDAGKWRTSISTFRNVQVRGAYPGVDLVYYASEQQLEYDFSIAPGADPEAILFHIEGADRVQIDSDGNLVVQVGAEQMRQHRPLAYQLDGALRKEVTVAYRLKGDQTVGFALGGYDPKLPLVIDPVLSYSTYLGGSSQDTGWDIAVDGSGNVYIAGESLSTQLTKLSTNSGAFQMNYGGGTTVGGDAFVAKLDASGSNLVYLTYLGGRGDDAALSIAIDSAGNAYLTGFTDSTDFPTRNPAQTNLSGKPEPYFGLYPFDAFVAKLNASGTNLIYSTFLGGDSTDEGIGIAVDTNTGCAFVTGFTMSANFPTNNNALQSTNAGFDDGFVTKVSSNGSAFVYSTYLGGTNSDEGEGIAVDSAGRAFVTGFTQSTNFPTANAFQPWLAGGRDAFVSVLGTNGTNLVQSSYLGGGSADDIGFRIVVDSLGNAYVTGSEGSDDFPITPGKLNPGGVFRSDNAGTAWQARSAGLLHVNVPSLAIDPGNPLRVYAGTWHGLARSTDGGDTWDTSVNAAPTTTGLAPAIAVDSVMALAIDPSTPATVYAGSAWDGIFKSLDGGTNWFMCNTGLLNLSIQALAIDPLSTATLYAGTDAGVFKSTNGATNWYSVGTGLGSVGVRALAVKTLPSSTIYVATAGGVYSSVDGGTNWFASNSGLTNLLAESLAINPFSPSTLFVGTEAGLFKSVNSGTNWSALQVGAGVSNIFCLAVNPVAMATVVYAGTSAGLFKSSDGGNSWATNGSEMNGLNVSALVINPKSPDTVFAATFGFGHADRDDVFVTKLKLGAKVGYSVVFGGSGDDAGWDLALGTNGNVYVTGVTDSTNFPVVQGLSLQQTNQGGHDAFVTAIDATGSAMLYSTYLGGQAEDFGYGIDVDPAGNAYVVGETGSANFPTNNALQPAFAGGAGDAFVAKILGGGQPTLNMSASGDQVLLSWPAYWPEFVLQTTTRFVWTNMVVTNSIGTNQVVTTNVVAATAWDTLTNAAVQTNGALNVTLGKTNDTRFFRLRR